MTTTLRETIKGVAENFSTDFVVSIEGTDLRSPPRAMRPATMSRRHRKLAQLWKFALQTAMKAAGLRLNYRIGFVLAHDLGATTEMLRATEDASSVPVKERLKEVVLYSISEEYFELRKKLGLAVDG
jgi:hypothetical protein